MDTDGTIYIWIGMICIILLVMIVLLAFGIADMNRIERKMNELEERLKANEDFDQHQETMINLKNHGHN